VNNDKKDSKSDNDIFWILAFWKDGKWQAVIGDAVTLDTETLEGGGYFNILLSPHRNLLQHKNYLKSILDRHSEVLDYTASTETLTNIISTYRGEKIIEKSSDNVSSGTVLFKPIIFEFEALIKKNLAQVIGESPDGYVTFNFNGIECMGFPIEIAGSITDSSQKVTCLAHPDTQNNIQSVLFQKKGVTGGSVQNVIQINASVNDRVTSLSVEAMSPVSSGIIVSIDKRSTMGGNEWFGNGEVILGINKGEKNSNVINVSALPLYTQLRFRITSITPSVDSKFTYIAGERVTVTL
jgi:hypothetical protein